MELVTEGAATLAPTDTLIAGCEKDGKTTHSRLHESCIGCSHVFLARLLRLVVPIGDRVDKRRVLQGRDLVGPLEKRISRVVHHREGHRWRHCLDVLDIKFRLHASDGQVSADRPIDAHIRHVAAFAKVLQVSDLVVLALELSHRHGRARAPHLEHARIRGSGQFVSRCNDCWRDISCAYDCIATLRPSLRLPCGTSWSFVIGSGVHQLRLYLVSEGCSHAWKLDELSDQQHMGRDRVVERIAAS
mmetsp:Transcript_5579/g.17160  ORF Transcript_5579/g.17160 Transcript_5579/m.17160 type:complete len:245 (+) Transcript_5579:1268-2002(+)